MGDSAERGDRRRDSGIRAKALTAYDIREQLLREHKRLRKLLVEVQGLARAAALEGHYGPSLRAAVRALLVEVAHHIDSEDELLVPAVVHMESFGEARATALRDEHEHQRALLRDMFTRSEGTASTLALAESTDGFVLRLLRDMRDEERDVLQSTSFDAALVVRSA